MEQKYPKLFERRKRTNLGPKRQNSTVFEFLDSSARPKVRQIRSLIQQWLLRCEPGEYKRLRGDLASKRDENFHGAFLELFTQELLLRTSHTIYPRKPRVGSNKVPDFEALDADGKVVLLECRCVTEESATDRKSSAMIAEVVDALNRTKSPNFFLNLDGSGILESSPPVAKWRKTIERWLITLDYSKALEAQQCGRFGDLPMTDFQHGDWTLKVVAWPKVKRRGDTSCRSVGIQVFGEGEIVTSRQLIAAAVKEKAGKYGKIDVPFVIVLNALGIAAIDREEVHKGLYGDEGIWRSPSNPRFSRVSAVLVVEELLPWSLRSIDAVLYHNPNPAIPYCGPLTRLQQGHRITGSSVGIELGCSPQTLIGMRRKQESRASPK